MKRLWPTCLLVVALSGAGACVSTVSANPDDYVGEYVFKPSNSAPGNFPSIVILKKDKTAVEIRFYSATGQIETRDKKWSISQTTGTNIVIGNFSHPIRHSGSTIQLGINDDLGQYYEKVR